MFGLLAAAFLFAGCEPPTFEHFTRPENELSFDKLFGQNCAGCHGKDGRWGPAPPLNDPLFLKVISDEALRQVVSAGRQGTLMPAFSKEHGGNLTREQVEQLAVGVRERWGAEVNVKAPLPHYAVTTTPPSESEIKTGKELFRTTCARCHGENGEGKDAGALHNTAFLSLVSRQFVRRIVITGRPDLGMPDYVRLGEKSPRHRPLTNEEITAIVSYVESWAPGAEAEATTRAATQPLAESQPSHGE